MRAITSTMCIIAIASMASAAVVRTGAASDAPVDVAIPAGEFVAGSDPAERERAYQLDEVAYGHSVTRENGWYDHERPRQVVETGSYAIMRAPVTNSEYARFISDTGRQPPTISEEAWKAQGLVHPYERARRFMWRDEQPPRAREMHPVVLVTWDDATAYAKWLSSRTGLTWRLPSELEWEKAARGTDGRIFPWGDAWDAAKLNSHDRGPFDTVPVGRFLSGASPFGMLDAAGQVFEWTGTAGGKDRFLVKGGSWDDKGCGVCRPAARHSRPRAIRHILIGFRLVRAD